jgi:hypothetical protein
MNSHHYSRPRTRIFYNGVLIARQRCSTANESASSAASASTLEESEKQVLCLCNRSSRAALSSRQRLYQTDSVPDEPESNAWGFSGKKGSFSISHYITSVDHDTECQHVARKATSAKEHIVGLNCWSDCLSVQGYSGWRIGADEMSVWRFGQHVAVPVVRETVH